MVSLSLLILSLTAFSAATNIHRARQASSKYPVDIVSEVKNVNDTMGNFGVSAAGKLEPFGDIGLGCGINWAQNQSFGGGLQAGTGALGLGGGFTVSPDSLTIGLGATGRSGTSANVQLLVNANGTVSFTFSSSANIHCAPTEVNGQNGFQCVSG